MATVTRTLNQLIDTAVEDLPRLRRGVTRWRLSFPRFRDRVVDDMKAKLFEDSRVQAMGLSPAFGSAAVDGETPIAVDVSNLEQLLAVIVEYLPQILDIIMKFINAFAAILIAAGLSLAAADAVSAADLNPLTKAEIHADSASPEPATTELTQAPTEKQPPDTVPTITLSATTSACPSGQCQVAHPPVTVPRHGQSVLVSPVRSGACATSRRSGACARGQAGRDADRPRRRFMRRGPVRRILGRVFRRLRR